MLDPEQLADVHTAFRQWLAELPEPDRIAVLWARDAVPVIQEREDAPGSLRRLAERCCEAQSFAELLAASVALAGETERLTDELAVAAGDPGESSVALAGGGVRRPECFKGTVRMSPQQERVWLRQVATRLHSARLRQRPRARGRRVRRQHRARRNGARAPPGEDDPPAPELAAEAAA